MLYLLLGSNLENRTQHLQNACTLIEQKLNPIHKKSSIYETAPWGNTQQPAFLNQALALNTSLPPTQILDTLLSIETQMGRVRTQKWESRMIDIDILLYNQQIVQSQFLTIPHPYLHLRRFALVPLLQIVEPNFLHPIYNTSIAQLLQNCPDTLPVTPYKLSL